jgi:uncharacterized protein YkwD
MPQGALSPGAVHHPADLAHAVYLPFVANDRVDPPADPTVDPADRGSSERFYREYYLSSEGTDINWTGSHAACGPGTTSAAFRDAVLRRVNYFRAMAGVPADVVFSTESNQMAQAAALMMSANRSLSHSPPPTWTCYSADGAAGAGSSNLYLGVYAWSAISGFMRDCGDGNYAAGHRRWILYPQTQEMGTGDIPPANGFPAANALRVFDAHMREPRPPTRHEFVAWPPPGYAPYQTVFARWSFSYAGADFSAASVSMSSGGANLPVRLERVVTGYGENTLVWIPSGLGNCSDWPRPSGDTVYSVTVRNVMIGGTSRDFSYDVVVFDPDA